MSGPPTSAAEHDRRIARGAGVNALGIVGKAALPAFLEQLPAESLERSPLTFQVDARNEGLSSASKVQYVIRGGDISKHGYSGSLEVTRQILSRDYLNNTIRIQNGACSLCGAPIAGVWK